MTSSRTSISGKSRAWPLPRSLCDTRFVKIRLRGWMAVGGLVLLCIGAIWLTAHRRARTIDTPAGLLMRLPGKDAVILSIDFAALRRAGLLDLLARSKTPEEPEYKQFVNKTDFDYTQDLDLALASFHSTGKFFLLRGRFHW